MKASKLIKLLEKSIETYGKDVDVFFEVPGFNCETIYNCEDDVNEYVGVENLENYPKHLIYESHGEVCGEGPGLVRSVCLIGKELVGVYG